MKHEERNEATMAKALARFGWTCGPEFWRRYYTDQWVFNLANAVETLTEERENNMTGTETKPGQPFKSDRDGDG